MSTVSLRNISSDGDLFEFGFVVPSDPLVIDFTDESGATRILHISVRASDGIIVLNDQKGGQWGDEIRIRAPLVPQLAGRLTAEVSGANLTLGYNGDPIYAGVWRNNICEAGQLQVSTDEVRVRRGSVGELFRQTDVRREEPEFERLRALFSNLTETLTSALKKAARDEIVPPIIDELARSGRTEPRVEPSASSEALAISFDDAHKLKLHKDCDRSGRFVRSHMDSSTPGLRLDVPATHQSIEAITIVGLEANTQSIALLLTNEEGKLVEKRAVPGVSQPTDRTFHIQTTSPIARIHVVFQRPKTGDTFRFETLVLSARSAGPASHDVSAPAIRRAIRRVAGVASIPSRVDGLRQAVEALAEQVDEIHVYLNGYEAIPTFLTLKPGIRVRLSQEFDDRGDAGKFYSFDPSARAFFLAFDDDIVYPKDYAATLTATAERHAAPCGVHGSILRLAGTRYYDLTSRYVFHFRDKNEHDRRVHVLGTGTLCIPPGAFRRPPSLPYRNMADIWVARHCAQNKIPQICVAREWEWLKPYGTDDGSIYQTNDREESAQQILVETEVNRLIEYLPHVRSKLPKVAVAIKTYNRLRYLKECISSMIQTISPGFETVLIVADDGSDDGTSEYLATLRAPLEVHVIQNRRSYVSGQYNAIVDRIIEIGADFAFVIDDDVVFKKEGWMSGYYAAALSSGYHHLCHFNLPHFEQLCAKRGESFPPLERTHSRFPLTAYGSVERCMGALFTLTPEVIKKVGFADEVNFFVRGLWHVDLSARCCRAGFNEYERFFDLADSNDLIELQNTLKESYTASISWESDEFKRANAPAERDRRWTVVRRPERIYISRHEATNGTPLRSFEVQDPISVNSFFDRVFVINLDRRDDRMAAIDARLRHLKIDYERYSAYDGRSPAIAAEYEAYAESRLSAPSGCFSSVMSSREFIFGYKSDQDRVAHLESALGGPAIRSAGAWAYLKTYRDILLEIVRRDYDCILVLDDDGLFHRDFTTLFQRAALQLPRTWKILQLGTMQYDWGWTRGYSENLYMPDGVVVGSHAVGLRREALPILLEYIDRWTLPFDIGPLHYACRAFTEESFVVVPNLVIQDQRESEINSSNVAEQESAKAENVYGWKREDYI